MMELYSTKATAKRALKNATAKAGIEATAYEITLTEDAGKFGYQLLFAVKPATSVVEALAESFDVVWTSERPRRKSHYIRGISVVGGPCALVWAIADSMAGSTRSEVIAACRAAGVTYGTARTQYQKWFADHQKNTQDEVDT